MLKANRKIFILTNPASRSGTGNKILQKMEQIFTRDGCTPVILESSGKGGMKKLARQITEDGEEMALLVVGGDGSVNEVLNGIHDFSKVLLGVIPAGSSNDFSRAVGVMDPLEAAVRILRNLDEGQTIARDIGRVRYLDLESGSWKERFFNVSAGLGFDAAVCAQADHSPLKKILNAVHLGKLIYIATAVRLILTSRGTTFRIRLEGEKTEERLYRDTLFAVCMNHKYEGGGFMFCPDASAEDGKLDICVPSGITRLSFFRLFPLAYTGRHAGHRNVVLSKARKIRVEAGSPQYLHTDGEAVLRTTHMEAEVVPHVLRFLL